VPLRHYGRWFAAAVVLGAFGLLVSALARADIEYGVILDYVFTEEVARGALNTLGISVAAMVLGIVLGVLFAVMALSPNPVTRTVARLYVWLFRGTPLLVQLLLWYNLSLVFPTIGGTSTNQLITPFVAALLGLGINEGAYMAEIVRAGISSVDEGQTEAATALGMTRLQALRRVVVPQAMRVIIPPTGNEFNNMLKNSSLAYTIQFGELLLTAVHVYTRNLQIVELLLTVSLWYLLLTTIFTVVQRRMELRYGVGQQRQERESLLRRININIRAGRRA
jgi:polar amino acid transport system permease protein